MARRYRHLFVLPSLATCSLLLLASSLSLGALVYLSGQVSATYVLYTVASILLSALLVTGILKRADRDSIASVRRIFGLYFITTCTWAIPVVVGVLAFRLAGPNAVTNEFVLGAFLAWAIELVVVNGAFLTSTLQSIAVSGVNPVVLLLTLFLLGALPFHDYYFSLLFGVVVLATTLAFLLTLTRTKTQTGSDSLRVMRAFLKTWVTHGPAELESLFSKYASEQLVTTGVIKAEANGRTLVLIVPGIHPGPFSPVGSYNLSELLHRDIGGDGKMPVVLHGTGGHERNAPTNAITSGYARSVAEFVNSLQCAERFATRGPLHSKVGITNITTLAFDREVIAILSDSPYRSDDLDPAAVQEARQAASALGLSLSLIDAHNSVNGEVHAQTRATKSDWERILMATVALPEVEFEVGFSNSAETHSRLGSDISEGGISVVLFAARDAKYLLVAADSNNAVSGLREQLRQTLNDSGIQLIELCTSDTHNLAARTLTSRGYFALGEISKTDDIVEAVRRLTDVAEKRLSPANLVHSELQLHVPLIGDSSLNDLARLTQEAISNAKTFAKAIVPLVVFFIATSLFY